MPQGQGANSLKKIAFFTAPKAFVNPHIIVIQRNAILSWKELGNDVEVWLAGKEEGVEQAAYDLGVHFIEHICRNDFGTPRIDSIFEQVRQKSDAEYLCYVNADILLFPDTLSTLEAVIKASRHFLIVGQRWDMNITASIDSDENWQRNLPLTVEQHAKLHRPAGSDYFIFHRSLFTDIPPFAVGRAGWDNWMIFHARQQGMEVIDATGSITAIHQNHDFGHLPGGKVHRKQPESLENLNLAGGRERMFTLYDTNRVISGGKIIKRKITRDRLIREISIFPLLRIKSVALARAFYTILNPKQAMKDKKKDQKMKDNIESTLKESK